MKISTFEVTSHYFVYFISISSLVFENDKWTFWGAALGILICLTSLKELEHRKLGCKVLILKYDLGKGLSNDMSCKMADTK